MDCGIVEPFGSVVDKHQTLRAGYASEGQSIGQVFNPSPVIPHRSENRFSQQPAPESNTQGIDSQQLLKATLDSSPNSIQVFQARRDEAGTVIDFTWVLTNRRWEEAHGDVIGKSLLTENPAVTETGVFKRMVEVTQTGVPQTYELHDPDKESNGWSRQTLVRLYDGVVLTTEDISECKQAEQALQAQIRQEETYRTRLEEQATQRSAELQANRELSQATLDASLDMIQVFKAVRDQTGVIVDFVWTLNNHTAEQIYGNVIGQRLLTLNPGVVEEGIFETFKQVVETGQPHQGERHYVHEQFDGWFFQSIVKLDDGVATTTTDISGRKRAEQAVVESEHRFRSLIEEAPVATGLYVGNEMIIAVANDRLLDYWGKDQSVLNKPLRQVVPELVEQGFFEQLDEVFITGQVYEEKAAPVKLSSQEGEGIFYFDYTYKPLHNAAGAVYAILNTAIDVTEQVKARMQLAEQKTYLENALSIANLGTFCVDLKTDRATYSENVRQWYGFDSYSESMETVLSKIHSEDFPRVHQVINAAIQSEEYSQHDFVFRIINPAEGGEVYVRSFGKAQYRDGQAESIIGVLQNVTDQVMARQKLEESEDRFRSIVQQSPAATLVLRGDDFIIDQINKPMLLFMGRGKEVIGQPLLAIMPELNGQFAWEQAQRVYRENVSFDQYEVHIAHNRTGVLVDYYYNVAYRPLREGDRVTGMIQVATDVTQQVMARQKLEVSEERYRQLSADLEQQVAARTTQLEASVTDLRRSNDNLQQFAYIASHDLQEPLRKIQSFGDLLKNQYADALGGGVDYLERMQMAASRMSTLIRDLLTYSRISTQQNVTAAVSLTNLVKTVLNDLEMIIEETGAQVTVGPLPTVFGDATQLGQLFSNLLANGLKFRRSAVKPVIQVRSQRVLADQLPPLVRPTRAAASYYQIEVSDNGIGFDDKYVDRIFQVFQRLHGKNQYAGTGIGLAICQKVVANHGGDITATSQPGQGATFSFYLPAVD